MKTKIGTIMDGTIFHSSTEPVTKGTTRGKSRRAKELYSTPRPEKVIQSREELIRQGLCVVCQAERFRVPENPIGPRCLSFFGGADVKAYKGMFQEMKLSRGGVIKR